MPQPKAQYLQVVQDLMTQLGSIRDRAEGVVAAYADRGYDASASDPVTTADLTGYGVVPYDLGLAMNTLSAVSALLHGNAAAQSGGYPAAVNKWRVL